MSIYQPTEKEIQQLQVYRENYPLDINRYKLVPTISFVELPYFLLGIDAEKCGCNTYYTYSYIQNSSINKIYDSFSLVQEVRKIILESDKIEKNHDCTRQYSQRGYMNELILSSNIRIINIINWLEHEYGIDPSFQSIINLPKDFVTWHKVRNEKEKSLKNKSQECKHIDEEKEKFLALGFDGVTFDFLGLEPRLKEVLKYRFEEMLACMKNNIPFSAILMIGSILEGILISVASQHSSQFKETLQGYKKSKNSLPFNSWSLADLIDVSYKLGYLSENVKKFSDVLRDFRNYIHPKKQVKAKFQPNMHTAKICEQVLYAAISDLSKKK
jgi:hypothetical protein